MADLKISQLPSVDVLTSSDLLPVVNSSTTKNITLLNLNNSLPLNTMVQSNSSNWQSTYTTVRTQSGTWAPAYFTAVWNGTGSPYRNMSVGNINLINFDTVTINTDSNTFELTTGNNNIALDGKIKINTPGIYNFNLTYNTFDIQAGSYYAFAIYGNTVNAGFGANFYTLLQEQPAPGTGRMVFDTSGTLRIDVVPTWLSFIFRPTGSTAPLGPFPTSDSYTGINQAPRITIIKIG